MRTHVNYNKNLCLAPLDYFPKSLWAQFGLVTQVPERTRYKVELKLVCASGAAIFNIRLKYSLMPQNVTENNENEPRKGRKNKNTKKKIKNMTVRICKMTKNRTLGYVSCLIVFIYFIVWI